MGIIHKYELGAGVDTTATFKLADTATDPTTVTVKIKNPDGAISSYIYGTDAEVTRTGTGVYRFSFEVNHVGDWWYRWEGAGAVVAAGERRIYVNSSEFS